MGERYLLSEDLLVGVASTLAADTGIFFSPTSRHDASRLQGSKLRKGWCAWSWVGKTANEGPVILGYAIDLSVAELAEFFDADPQRSQDTGKSEQASRAVIPVAVIPKQCTASSSTPSYGDIRLQRMPVFSYHVKEGIDLKWFMYNRGSAALTTGLVVSGWAMWQAEWLND